MKKTSRFKKNASGENIYDGSKFQTAIFLLGVLVIILTGTTVNFYFKKNAENKNRSELVNITDVAGAAINPRRLVTLQGSATDFNNPDYQRLKEQLVLINTSLRDFGTKWIYLMKNDGENWVFLVDPLDENSADYTAPGTIYKDHPKELDAIFDKKTTIISGPYSDQWGEFVSAFSPIKDIESGEILGVLGSDIDAKIWKLNILRSQIFPVTISFFIFILWTSFFVYSRKKIKHEKEIKFREERFRSIAETSKDVIYRTDLSGRINYASPAVEKVLKFSQAEVIGLNFMDFIPSSEYSKAKTAFQKLLQGEAIDSFEVLINCKNKEQIQADLNLAPIHEEEKIIEIQGTIRDITQRKMFEEEIKKQTKKLKESQLATLNVLEDVEDEKEKVSRERDKIDAILHSIGDGVFVVDKYSKIIMINKITSDISGYSQKELLGKKYNEKLRFIFERDEKENEEFIKEAMRTGEIKEMSNHTMLIRKDGSKVPVADSAAPLKNKRGEIIGCVVVFRDVTKEREIDKMKSEFISVASHQLKTPLTGIKWFAELLSGDKNKNFTEEQKEFIYEISSSNERMISLVNDLLNVSRIETGKNFEIEKKKTDIIPLIKDVIKNQNVMAKSGGVSVICNKDHPDKLILDIDGDKIEQVFQNLVSNAIKYSPKGSKIVLGCEEKKESAIFSVKDSGLGIPPDQQGKIFEKFFRASNVLMTGSEGTGLGLYIAKSIVEAHEGKIWFESGDKKGTIFFVSLPKINKNSKN